MSRYRRCVSAAAFLALALLVGDGRTDPVGRKHAADDQWPRTNSARPTAQDWLSAPDVVLDRHRYSECKAKRLREWLSISCSRNSIPLAAAKVLFGADDDVKAEAWGWGPSIVVFPVRPGDKRVLQQYGESGSGGVGFPITISEHWPTDAAQPVIVLN